MFYVGPEGVLLLEAGGDHVCALCSQEWTQPQVPCFQVLAQRKKQQEVLPGWLENLRKKWQEEPMGSKQGRRPWQASISTYLAIYTHTQHLGFFTVVAASESAMGRSPGPRRGSALLLPLFLICFFSGGTKRADATRQFTLINQCKTEVWPAVTPGESFGGGGYVLRAGESVVFTAPVGWSGRVWGRTGCDFDSAGNGTCETGGCGTSLQCTSATGATPATLAEFTLAGTDYYDVSLVDGFNLPVVVTPTPASANWTGCPTAGCDGDLRRGCPSELAVKGNGGKVVACRSACDVFGTDQYCCRGQFANPVACQPTFYSKKFKAACPAAYSYAYDDPSSIFTCAQSPDYTITFCADNMKQPVCSYRNSRLVCSGSSRSTTAPRLVMLLLLLSSVLALQFATPV